MTSDPVVEGDYKDYRVDSLFSTEFRHSQFREELCETSA